MSLNVDDEKGSELKINTDKFRRLTSKAGKSGVIGGGNDKLREARVSISSTVKAYGLIAVE